MNRGPTSPPTTRFNEAARGPLVSRMLFVGGLLGAVYLGLFVRLAYIQCFQHEGWRALAADGHFKRIALPAQRGPIMDRRGARLAITRTVDSIYADPRRVAAKASTARILARGLKVDYATIRERLCRRKRFVWIKRRVTKDEADWVRRIDLRGVGFRQERKRFYPNGDFLCHVLGFLTMDGAPGGGVEQTFHHAMSGRPGFEVVQRDARQRTLSTPGARRRAPEHGHGLVLTIDSALQQIAEDEVRAARGKWQAEWVAAVALCPWTGDVLAMANTPHFDLNRYNVASRTERMNHAVASCVEPGSALKPCTAAWALQLGKVTPETVFDCEHGACRFGRRVLHDHRPYDRLSVRDIIVKSSNVGIAKIAQLLGPKELYRGLRRFGFGARTGIRLPGESAGMLAPPRTWSSYSMSSIAMGQEMAASALGLAVGFAAFANGGWLVRPRIALGLASSDGRGPVTRFALAQRRRVLRPEVARVMSESILAEAVRRGTGRRASLAGYRVGGKTGSAEIAAPGGRGYVQGAYAAVFVGFAPVEAPRLVVAMVVFRPHGSHFGGTVSAPHVGRILERSLAYLGVPRGTGRGATHAGITGSRAARDAARAHSTDSGWVELAGLQVKSGGANTTKNGP